MQVFVVTACFVASIFVVGCSHIERPEGEMVGSATSTPSLFRYDPTRGVCVNEDGDTGFNKIPIEEIRKTGKGECVHLSNVKIFPDLEGRIGSGWNLRGAKLDRARLSFNDLHNCQCEGTQFIKFDWGYATITGTGDRHTILPADADCVLDEEQRFVCSR